MQILASGKTGAQRYDDNNINKPVPDLDLISIGQTNQRAFEETQGWCYSNNKGSTDSQATDLSIIEEGDVNDYNPSLAQLIQTYVANNSFLEVNGSSTANNIILEPRKIANVNSPDGVNYSKSASLPFAFRDNLRFCFRATATNTGAVQFSITGLSGLSGAIDSIDENGNTLTGGEIVNGKFYEIVLTGTATTKKVIFLDKIHSPISFRATMSADQNIGTATTTKVQFNTETYDIGGYYDNATNYRFTPLVAGTYLFSVSLGYQDAGSTAQSAVLYLYKNGAIYSTSQIPYFDNGICYIGITTPVQLNGSTDYVEVYARIAGTSANTVEADHSFFSGFKIF